MLTHRIQLAVNLAPHGLQLVLRLLQNIALCKGQRPEQV